MQHFVKQILAFFTYKRKKGFQPLHICWGSFLIDVMFRKGSAHSNHGTDYIDRVSAVVKLIRNRYSQDVKDYVNGVDDNAFNEITKGKIIWRFTEFGARLKSWSKHRRCIFTKLHRDETGQNVLDFSKPDSIIYTNIGNSPMADQRLMAAGGEHYFEAETIVRTSHARGVDAYKQDVTAQVIPVTVYPNTFRRMLIDFAVKICSHARDTVMKVPNTIYQNMNIEELWRLCQSPPRIQYA